MLCGCLSPSAKAHSQRQRDPSSSPQHTQNPINHCHLRFVAVYDKDLLSSDDFLGQATVDLADLDLASTSLFSSNHTLPLSGVGRFGRKEQHGEICVAVWFSAEGAGAGGDVAGALTLMPQPGFTGAPQIVQARGSWLYEEPLFVCLSVKVNAVVNALGDGTSGPHDGSSQASLDRSPGSAASESSWSDERK